MKGRRPCDRVLLTCVLVLLLIGILMVFSSSFYYSLQRFSDPYYFLKKELLWAGVGLVAMTVFTHLRYQRLKKWAVPGLAVLFALLVAVLFTKEINGARRWISIAGVTLMPGELAKPTIALFLAAMLSKDAGGIRRLKDALPYLAVLVAVFALIVKQPNLSTALIVFSMGFVQLILAGLPLVWVFGGVGVGGAAAAGLILTSEYRMERFTTFLDPFKDTSEKGWQVIQSLYALGSGGLFGVGMGESIQNKLYLPEPQNDFIFATIGEEFGYLGSMAVILLFVVLLWRGVKIALGARDRFGFFLAAGITATIGIQTLLNIAVATSSMPVTGVPLPFISYGGNSLALLLAQMGILLNISKNGAPEERES